MQFISLISVKYETRPSGAFDFRGKMLSGQTIKVLFIFSDDAVDLFSQTRIYNMHVALGIFVICLARKYEGFEFSEIRSLLSSQPLPLREALNRDIKVIVCMHINFSNILFYRFSPNARKSRLINCSIE